MEDSDQMEVWNINKLRLRASYWLLSSTVRLANEIRVGECYS